MQRCDRLINLAWMWLLASFALACFPVPSLAQVVPDATLGAGRNSVTTTTGDRTDITGGLRRSSAVFHSFDRFSIGTDRQVYFANPTGIRNIFSRVTGGSISNIDGLLGVTGSANLFFMNPNGIVFGPNARLDVSGSFLATTANVLEFPDNQKFAATGDRAVPLVEVNIPIGLQIGANSPAMVKNEGNLTAGRDLTLAAGNISNTGQLTATGGNLTIAAKDTVQMRDSTTQPVRVVSGGETRIQGDRSIDIFALNHPDTLFQSGSHFSLISDGRISGDAHFRSGGDFSIRTLSGNPGAFVSLNDPVFIVGGNYAIGTYNGASLKVEAGGNITGNNITINAPAPAATIPAADPDFATLTNGRALILRAGGSITTGDISTTDLASTTPDNVILSATGPISIGNTALSNSILARSATINTPSTVQIIGGINARLDAPGTAGNVRIGTTTQPSSITVGIISARNSSTGDGGDITIRTSGNFTTTGAFDLSGSGYQVPGATNPAGIVSIASQANVGRSGDISITAGGAINVAAGISSASNFNGRGGDIALQGTAIDTTRGVISSQNNNALLINGVGGDVRLTATTGDIRSGSINSSSRNNDSGNSYSIIQLNSNAGSIFLNQANLSTSNLGSYFAGNVELSAANQIDIANNSILSSDGYFGIISLTTTRTPTSSITIRDSQLTTRIPATTAVAATPKPPSSIDIRSGNVTIDNTQVSTEAFAPNPTNPALSRQADSGKISVIGDTIQVLRNSQIRTVTNPNVIGNSGAIVIGIEEIDPSAATITLQNSNLSTSANGQGNSGNIQLGATQSVTTTGSSLRTTTNPSNTNGVAGSVSITANATSGPAIQLTDTGIDAAAFGIGGKTGGVTLQAASGDITLTGTQALPTRIFTETYGSQPTENLSIITGNATIRGGTIALNNYQLDATVVSGSGAGGNISVQSNGGRIDLNRGGLETNVNSAATGSGGNITVESNGGPIAISNGFQINSATNATNPLATAGKGGDVSIRSNGGQVTIGGSTIDARTTGTQAGGNVEIRSGTGQLSVLNNSTINASTSGARIGGNVSLTTEGSNLNLSSGSIATTVETTATGNGGAIALNSNGGAIAIGDTTANTAFNINAQTQATNLTGTRQENGRGGNVTVSSTGGAIAIVNNSSINASTTGTKDGGTTQISSQGGNVLLDRSSVLTTVGPSGSGNGGTIALSSGSGTTTLSNQATINASTDGSGNAGTVNLDAANLQLGDSQISARSRNSIGGNISLSGLTALQLNNSNISASTVDGTAGNLSVNPGGTPLSTIALTNSELSLAATGNGSAGDIRLNTQQLTLQSSAISAETAGAGSAGSVRVDANGSPAAAIALSGNSRLAVAASGTGNAGSIALSTRQLTLTDGSQISGSTAGGQGDNIDLTGLNTLQVSDSRISASTTGNGGRAGNVTVAATDAVTLSGLFNGTPGGISTQADSGKGSAGRVTISTPQLTVQNGATIAASTDRGTGNDIGLNLNTLQLDNGSIAASTVNGIAGNLLVNEGGTSATSIRLSNQSNLSLAATGTGSAGRTLLNTRQLTLQDSAISADTVSGVGNNIELPNLDTLQLNNSRIAAATVTGEAGNLFINNGAPAARSIALTNGSSLAVAASGTGNAGSIALNTQNLTLQNSSLSASTSGSGQAGNLTVSANGSAANSIFLAGSRLTLGSTGSGSAGNVLLNTRQLTLEDAQISASTFAGVGGGVTLQGLTSLQLNNSQIAASTSTGQAGSVSIAGANFVNLANNSLLSVAASNGGQAGNLTINAYKLSLNSGSRATVSSPTGQAGNLTIVTQDLQINQGELSAATGGSGNGANIRIQGLQRPLIMRFGSLISANAGEQANGGNITITAPYIIGQTFENSDIVANAVQGRGGTIAITANGIFGLQFRPKLTPRSDITASSEFGLSGTVALNTLNIDPNRGLIKLPTDLVDPTRNLTQGCGSAAPDNRFTIAGRGGVPSSPTAPLAAQTTQSDWVALEPGASVAIALPFTPGVTIALQAEPSNLAQTVCLNSWTAQQRSAR